MKDNPFFAVAAFDADRELALWVISYAVWEQKRVEHVLELMNDGRWRRWYRLGKSYVAYQWQDTGETIWRANWWLIGNKV